MTKPQVWRSMWVPLCNEVHSYSPPPTLECPVECGTNLDGSNLDIGSILAGFGEFVPLSDKVPSYSN